MKRFRCRGIEFTNVFFVFPVYFRFHFAVEREYRPTTARQHEKYVVVRRSTRVLSRRFALYRSGSNIKLIEFHKKRLTRLRRRPRTTDNRRRVAYV